ncbi:MAG TPA: ABC transporter ATP-binding protein [Aliidongia sp.]|uniref:ABC transporter ATP-binding protein n=1 Tax=Aliidongia sp. TaxID=1914230 RepID=UPI002DDC9C91|nr:ABC transporter ATP-binding protein [Aliidongia sp.]HEV2673338.1 ABC transporter ATP-binding protein [Aliidongia sp.]
MLAAKGISVRYRQVEAVGDVSIEAPGGAITALVGPNGAGKSSLIQAIMGAVRGAKGSILIDGVAVDRLGPTGRARAGIALVPQGRQVFPHLTVWENLQVMADAIGLPDEATTAALQRFPILETRRRLPAGVLSGGEQQMLALARALMTKPKILLLDEPSLGLAPLIVEELVRTVVDLAQGGMAVLMAEPSIRFIRSHIDRGYVMFRGRIVAEATGASALETAYLAQMDGSVSRAERRHQVG